MKSIPRWMKGPIPLLDRQAMADARKRQSLLTKPGGSLGRLEELVVTLAGMQADAVPRIPRTHIVVFGADHGVACEGGYQRTRRRLPRACWRTWPAAALPSACSRGS